MSVKSKSIQSKKQSGSDERLKKISPLRVLLNRPELGALGGSILVFIFFGIVAGDTGMFSAYGTLNFLDFSACGTEGAEAASGTLFAQSAGDGESDGERRQVAVAQVVQGRGQPAKRDGKNGWDLQYDRAVCEVANEGEEHNGFVGLE